ncbi:MAG TPA: hypothetical protein VK009_04075, partial [Chloroflexota bacterium]|nr:hypothetical protein [Chloroflexota bacterium]
MFGDPFHETRFGAHDHELRGQRPSSTVHERLVLAATHESRSTARALAPARAQAEANTPEPPATREPRRQMRHTASSSTKRQPAYSALAQEHAAADASHPAASSKPVRKRSAHAAHRGHQPPKHHMPYIHARHLARVRYQQELKQYHLALRQWRHLLVVRQHLLTMLASLERRLARQAQHPPKRQLAGTVYEIDGTWYAQSGRRKPRVVRAA